MINPALLVIIYAVSTAIMWLGMHINEFVYAGISHNWDRKIGTMPLTFAMWACIIGYIAWLILALVVQKWDLTWWHPVAGIVIMFVVGITGGILTGKSAIHRTLHS